MEGEVDSVILTVVLTTRFQSLTAGLTLGGKGIIDAGRSLETSPGESAVLLQIACQKVKKRYTVNSPVKVFVNTIKNLHAILTIMSFSCMCAFMSRPS